MAGRRKPLARSKRVTVIPAFVPEDPTVEEKPAPAEPAPVKSAKPSPAPAKL